MHWLMWRDLAVVVRHGGFLAATAAHLAVLTAFVLIWGDGVPVLREYTVLEQLTRLDLALLSVMLPWVALRCSLDEGRNGFVRLAAATARKPSSVIVARTGGLGGALVTVALSALPLFVLGQQISAVSVSSLASAMAPLIAISVLAAVIATGAKVLVRGRLSSWLAATAATVIAAGASPIEGGVLRNLVLAIAVAGVLAMYVDRRLRYLSESPEDV